MSGPRDPNKKIHLGLIPLPDADDSDPDSNALLSSIRDQRYIINSSSSSPERASKIVKLAHRLFKKNPERFERFRIPTVVAAPPVSLDSVTSNSESTNKAVGTGACDPGSEPATSSSLSASTVAPAPVPASTPIPASTPAPTSILGPGPVSTPTSAPALSSLSSANEAMPNPAKDESPAGSSNTRIVLVPAINLTILRQNNDFLRRHNVELARAHFEAVQKLGQVQEEMARVKEQEGQKEEKIKGLEAEKQILFEAGLAFATMEQNWLVERDLLQQEVKGLMDRVEALEEEKRGLVSASLTADGEGGLQGVGANGVGAVGGQGLDDVTLPAPMQMPSEMGMSMPVQLAFEFGDMELDLEGMGMEMGEGLWDEQGNLGIDHLFAEPGNENMPQQGDMYPNMMHQM